MPPSFLPFALFSSGLVVGGAAAYSLASTSSKPALVPVPAAPAKASVASHGPILNGVGTPNAGFRQPVGGEVWKFGVPCESSLSVLSACVAGPLRGLPFSLTQLLTIESYFARRLHSCKERSALPESVRFPLWTRVHLQRLTFGLRGASRRQVHHPVRPTEAASYVRSKTLRSLGFSRKVLTKFLTLSFRPLCSCLGTSTPSLPSLIHHPHSN